MPLAEPSRRIHLIILNEQDWIQKNKTSVNA